MNLCGVLILHSLNVLFCIVMLFEIEIKLCLFIISSVRDAVREFIREDPLESNYA